MKRGHALKPMIEFYIDPVTRLGLKPTLTEEVAENPAKLQEWKEQSSNYNKKKESLEENIVLLYGIIIDQCTESLISELKGHEEFDEKDIDSDALWLLEKLKDISAGINLKKRGTSVC